MVGKRLVMIGISFAVLTAATVAPASAVAPGQPKADPAACTELVSKLTGGLTQVTGALQGLPPDLSKATGVVSSLVTTVQSLISSGCLPDPLKAVPVPVAGGDVELLPIPGLPGPSIPPCAAPAADLLSKLLGLVANLLKALAGALPDLVGLISQVTGATTTVTDLTTSVGGAPACLPVAAPIKQ